MYLSPKQVMMTADHWGFDKDGRRSCFTSPRDARKNEAPGAVCTGAPPAPRKRGGKRRRMS